MELFKALDNYNENDNTTIEANSANGNEKITLIANKINNSDKKNE